MGCRDGTARPWQDVVGGGGIAAMHKAVARGQCTKQRIGKGSDTVTRPQCDGTAEADSYSTGRWFERREVRHVGLTAATTASARPAHGLAGSKLSPAPRRRAWPTPA